MYGLKLHTNGLVMKHKLTEERETYIALQKAIDVDCMDIVHAVNLPDGYCMVVDDEGLLKDKPYINLVASYLYGTLEHGQPICGDVLIMKDEYTDDGVETVGLDEEDFMKLFELLTNSKAEIAELHKVISRKLGMTD